MLAAGALGEQGDQKQISRLVTLSTILEMESFKSICGDFLALLLEGRIEVRVVAEEIALALSRDRIGKLWFKTFFATEVS